MATGTPSIARNAPCPCGSGRRYKDCCSRLDGAGAAATAAAPSESMRRALALQMDSRFPDAKLLYEQALAERGDDVDALNMLALVEYNLGHLDRAATLVEDAARRAPWLGAARANQAIIAAAKRVRAFRPFVFDPQADRHPPAEGTKPLVHIYKIAGNAAGGTEWHCLDLAHRLRDDANVVLWTESHALDDIFTRNHPVRRVDPARGEFPQGGTLVIAGSYHRVGAWYAATRFRRVVLLYNVVDPIGAAAILEQLCLPTQPKVELLFASEWLRRSTQLPGRFEPSPIDTDLFSPQTAPPPAARGAWARLRSRFGRDAVAPAPEAKPDGFVVGRLSRDDPVKYHPGAPEFYRRLAAAGMRVRLMGAMPLAASLQGVDGIELLPQSSIPAPEFLHSLDCFTYRTDPAWTEAWGRVVIEAMATGLPVVVHANGGYAQLIRHGENGFLFHSDDEAGDHLRRLAGSPGLRLAVGTKARETVLELLSDRAFRGYAEFYFQ